MRRLSLKFGARTGKRQLITAAFLLSLSALAIVCFAMLAARKTSGVFAQQPTYARFWPSFTMDYTIRSVDPTSGKVVVDQTHHLVVVNEHAWRDDVTQDRVDPKEAGSYSEVKGGTLHNYSAARNFSRDLPLGSADTVTGPRQELDPTLYGRIQGGALKGWQDATPLSPGRVAKTRTASTACSTGTCTVEERVEFDAGSINHSPSAGATSPIGGIAVFGQRTVNGKVISTFEAQSLQVSQFASPANAVTAAANGTIPPSPAVSATAPPTARP